MTPTKRLWLDPTIISLAIIAAIGALFAYWLLWPDNPVTVMHPQAVTVDKEVYAPGDRIIYLLDYCKTRKIQGKVSRSLVDGISIPYAAVESDLQVGCRKIFIYDLTIPEFAPSGTYHLEVSGEYRVNPLRTSRNSWRTVDFQVLNPTVGPLKKLQDEIEKNSDDIKQHDEEDKAWQRKHSCLGANQWASARIK